MVIALVKIELRNAAKLKRLLINYPSTYSGSVSQILSPDFIHSNFYEMILQFTHLPTYLNIIYVPKLAISAYLAI